MAGLLQLAYNFTQLAAPYFSKLIIQYVGRRRTPYWVGIAYAVVLLLIGLLGSVLHNSYMFIVCSSDVVYTKLTHVWSGCHTRYESENRIENSCVQKDSEALESSESKV